MKPLPLLIIYLAALTISSCASVGGQPQGTYTLSIDVRGQSAYGPQPLQLSPTSLKLANRSCPNDASIAPITLNVQAFEVEAGVLSYYCSSNCYISVGEASYLQLKPGESTTVGCDGVADLLISRASM
jgi:hypothetical protein